MIRQYRLVFILICMIITGLFFGCVQNQENINLNEFGVKTINTVYNYSDYAKFRYPNGNFCGTNLNTDKLITSELVDYLRKLNVILYKNTINYPYKFEVYFTRIKAISAGMGIEPVHTFDIVVPNVDEFIIIHKTSFKYDNFNNFATELFFGFCMWNGVAFELVPLPNSKRNFDTRRVFVTYQSAFINMNTDYFVSAVESYILRKFSGYNPIVRYEHITEKELKKIKKNIINAEIVKEYR